MVVTPRSLPHLLDLAAAILVIAFAVGIVYFPFPNPDLYWLLATGRRMVETHAFIYQDPFTFTVAGSPWSPPSWLSAIAYFLLYKTGGMGAVTALRMLLVAGIVALTLRTLRRTGMTWAVSAPLLVMGILVAHTRLTDRGQLFEYLFLAGLVGFLLRSHEVKGRSFFVLPVAMQLLWVQFHSSFLLGPTLALIFFASEWIAARVPMWRPLHTHDFRRAFTLVGLLLVACLVNPNPRAFLLQPFDPAQRELLARFTLEWKSPFDPAIAVGNFHPYYEMLLGLAAASIILNFRKLPLAPAAMMLATAWLSLQSHRFRVEFALVAVPMIVLLMADVEARLRKGGKRRFLSPRVEKVAGLAFALLLIVLNRGRFTEARDTTSGHPARAFDFVLQNDIAQRPFHSIAYGSYLLWDGYGERRTFIDGRNFDARLYRDFLLAQASDEGWSAAVRKYQLDSFILPAWSVADAGMRNVHERLIRERARWDLVHIDEDAFVYVAKASADSTWLDTHAYRVYHPATFAGARLSREQVLRAVAELERVVADAPADSRAWLHLAAAYEASGELEKALGAIDRAIAIAPGDPALWDQKARVALAAGKLDDAREAAAIRDRLRALR